MLSRVILKDRHTARLRWEKAGLACLSLLMAAAALAFPSPEPQDSAKSPFPDVMAEVVTLANGEVLILNLPPATPLPELNTKAVVSERSDLIGRLRKGFAMSESGEPRVLMHQRWLVGKQQYVDRIMSRAGRFMHLAVSEAEKRGLPTELALLPVIESAYDPAATSRSQAAGLWQFIPDTGKLHGLRQNWFYDGRRDPVESTRAAYDYLSQLYRTFGDWSLVLASYNAGPGTVSRAMKRNAAMGLPTDYWSLRLPAETQAYVPRFLAVVALFKAPERFAVNLPEVPDRPFFRTIELNDQISLADAADLTGLSPAMLRSLNPALRRDATDPKGPHRLHLPASLDIALENRLLQRRGGTPVLVAAMDTDPVLDLSHAERVSQGSDSINPGRHVVARGDTWYSVARRHNLSVPALQAANPQSDAVLSVGAELRIPDVRRVEAPVTVIPVSSMDERRIEVRRTVRRGETLDSIRRQYQVTLAELRAWNGDLQTLKVGQTLVLRVLPSLLDDNKSL